MSKSSEIVGSDVHLMNCLDREAPQYVVHSILCVTTIFTAFSDVVNAKLTIKEMKHMQNFGQKSINCWQMN